MSDQESRQVIAHGAIGLAACFGAYMVLVDGPRKDLTAARAEVLSLTAEVNTAEGLRDHVPAMSLALEKSGHEAAAIRELGRPAREGRGLYAAITSLASASHVRLDELNPVTIPRNPSDSKPSGDTVAAYNMVAIGSYRDVAEFIAALRTQLGYSLITSVRLTPVQDEKVKQVRAVIETSHFSFDPTPGAEAPASAGAH